MNSKIIELLSQEQENVLKNQKERKMKDDLRMQEFLEKAKKNSRELNKEIFQAIIKAFIESQKNQHDELFEFYYDNIGYPKAIIEGNTFIGSSKRSRILDRLKSFVDEEELHLAQKYNKCNYDNKVVFIALDDEYVVPAIFYDQEYKKLGIYFFFDYDVTMKADDNQRHLNQLLNNIVKGKYDNLNIISEETKELTNNILSMMKNKKETITDYQKKCNTNANYLLLYICRYFLKEYQSNPNTDYCLKLPCLNNHEDICNELEGEDLYNYNDYVICSPNDKPVILVAPDKKLGNKIVYRPVLKWNFLYMIKKLGFESFIKDNELQIKANPLEFEQTIINISKEKTKKR